ncbi:MAG: hypothetical protein GTO14_06520 [Anaerolineales bacterium]|nr:hypothetical protein [Anaerolineales bacterium]
MTTDVLRQAKTALVALDAKVLVSLYAEDFLFEDTASGDRISDKAELKSYFDRLFSLPNVNFSNVSFFGLGERAAGQWTWGGSSLQSGQRYSIRGASLFKIEHDRIKEEIIFYDPRSAYS